MTDSETMTARVTERLREQLGPGFLAIEQPQPDTVKVRIDKRVVVKTARILCEEMDARFMITVATDTRPLSGDFSVAHVFSLDTRHLYVVLEFGVDPDDLEIDSITNVIPGADWAEREAHDAVGVIPKGHPDPRRLMLADDWPEGVFPLRRDFPHDAHPPPATGCSPPLKPPPAGASVIPLGPFFPVLEEPAYFRLFVEGETVVGCDYRGFYNHRGIEKMADSTLTYNEIPFIAERICGICGFIHSTCYCQAVEKAAGLAVPRRAAYIRTIMLELERLHSHLLWLGIAGHIIGFDTVLMQTWRMREPVMWLCEEISGNRKTYGMNIIGGVRRDILDPIRPKILDLLVRVEKEVLAVKAAILDDTSLLLRTKGVGKLTNEWAKKLCVVGPPARASGRPIDARVDHPYAAYDAIQVSVPVFEEGDTWARVLVRLEETVESIRLLRQATSEIPEGPICTQIEQEIPPGRLGISVVEAPRGEAVHVVMTGGDNRPYRWRVRAPTYPNLQAVPQMVANDSIADVPITIGSLDPCFSCTERVEAVDLETNRIRVYRQEELISMFKVQTGRGGGT